MIEISDKLDAIHFVCTNKIATEVAVKSFRAKYPESNYIMLGDGGDDFSDIAEKYNCKLIQYERNLGYPKPGYGHRKPNITEYLKRFRDGVKSCSAKHIITMENDVYILNRLPIKSTTQMLVTQNALYNTIHPTILEMIKTHSGNNDIDNFYGMGGGSIFNRETFINIFDRFYSFIDEKFEEMQSIFQTVGWTDCIISMLFMYAGKKHTINGQLLELNSGGGDYYDNIEERFASQYSVIHHYKKYYNKGEGGLR